MSKTKDIINPYTATQKKLTDIQARLHNESCSYSKYSYVGKISAQDKEISIEEIEDILNLVKSLETGD